jgi:hypothetical protein
LNFRFLVGLLSVSREEASEDDSDDVASEDVPSDGASPRTRASASPPAPVEGSVWFGPEGIARAGARPRRNARAGLQAPGVATGLRRAVTTRSTCGKPRVGVARSAAVGIAVIATTAVSRPDARASRAARDRVCPWTARERDSSGARRRRSTRQRVVFRVIDGGFDQSTSSNADDVKSRRALKAFRRAFSLTSTSSTRVLTRRVSHYHVLAQTRHRLTLNKNSA